MSIQPTFQDLLWQACLGARAWFLGMFFVGLGPLLASQALLGAPEPRAVVLTFFMPLMLAALMGSTSLSAYRVRHADGPGSELAVRVFVAAVLWNALLAGTALVVDRAVTHYGLLARAPLPLPVSIGHAALAAVAVALLSIWPRRGPS